MKDEAKRGALTPLHVDQHSPLALYEAGCRALAEAVQVDEVMNVRDLSEQLRLYGRQARDTETIANAIELRFRAERRLGEKILEAKEAGQIVEGRPRKGSPDLFGNGAGEEQFVRVTLAEVGINRKLSSAAQKLAEKPAPLFERVIRQAREKVLGGKAVVVNPLKDLNTAEKIVKRAARQAELAARQKALPEKVYGVILEDPEWDYETWSEAGKDRAAENHYPTTPTAELMKRDVGKIAAPDCVRYVWTTVPMLKHGIAYAETDGFTYKSHWIWDKVELGTGHWNRNRHEILIVATRGNVPAPAKGTQLPSIMVERVREHSRKPEWAYEMIEADYPDLPKIELNARPPLRPGWDHWGYEVPDSDLPPSGRPADPPRSEAATREDAGAAADGAGEAIPSVSPAIVRCAVCGVATGRHYLMCDEDEGEWCPACFEKTPCGRGEHGEGCATAAFDDRNEEIAGGEPPTAAGEGADAAGDELRTASAPVPVERAFYDDLVQNDRLKGKHTLETARPIVVASRACDPIIPVKQLAEDLGHPLGTVQGWTHKCKVTDHARLQDTARHATEVSRARHAAANAGASHGTH